MLKVNLAAVGNKINENDLRRKRETVHQQTSDGKKLLRRVMGNIIPESIAQGTKQGFSSPDASWFKGESIDLVRRTFFETTPMLANIMDISTVRSLIGEHLSGEKNRRLLIWSLFSLETLLTAGHVAG
jgi:asparagine synthase (glutamine-hydrolysing)